MLLFAVLLDSSGGASAGPPGVVVVSQKERQLPLGVLQWGGVTSLSVIDTAQQHAQRAKQYAARVVQEAEDAEKLLKEKERASKVSQRLMCEGPRLPTPTLMPCPHASHPPWDPHTSRHPAPTPHDTPASDATMYTARPTFT